MLKTVCLSALSLMTTFLTYCNVSNGFSANSFGNQNKEIAIIDSVELTTLVRQVYKWHMNNLLDEFPYKYEKQAKNIIIGIDWEAYNKNMDVFKSTKFFTDQFLSCHKNIALNIDSSIKKADIKWRNMNDGIPLWDLDADSWCGCQAYPDNYWETLTLYDLKIENNSASFYWKWESPSVEPHKYKMTAKKIGNKWKIDSMEGFDYYRSVAHYNDLMRE